MENLDFRVTDKEKLVKIYMNAKDQIGSIEPITVIDMFKKSVEKFGDHPALKLKNPITKDYEVITYNEYRIRVEKIAKVFIKLGLERHGSVAILAFNSVEWFVSGLAAIHAG